MIARVHRARTEADFAPLRALAQSHAQFERSGTVVPADWSRRMADLTTASRVDVFAAKAAAAAAAADEAIGYASVTYEVSTWTGTAYAHLDCLYVDPGHRGHGAGLLLFDAVVRRARSAGHTELQWQTPAWNERAIRFYRRTGAQSRDKVRFTLPLTATA